MRELGSGVLGGARGVFTAPMRAVRVDGLRGLMRGVLTGVVGAGTC
jgi:hypothetical protein